MQAMQAKPVAGDGSSPPWGAILVFLLLTYGITWAVDIPAVWPKIRDALATGTSALDMGAPAIGLTMFIPMIAALITQLLFTRESLRGTFGLARAPRRYLLAFATPVVLLAIALAIGLATGAGHWIYEKFTGMPLYLEIPCLLVGVTVMSTLNAFGEEYGWRGFLLRRLLVLGEERAALFIGLVWGFWHFPLMLAGLNFPGTNIWLGMAVFTASCVALSFLLTYLYPWFGGSPFLAAVFHAALNVMVGAFMEPRALEGRQIIVNGVGVAGLVVIALGAVIVRKIRGPLTATELVARSRPALDGSWRDWVR